MIYDVALPKHMSISRKFYDFFNFLGFYLSTRGAMASYSRCLVHHHQANGVGTRLHVIDVQQPRQQQT